MGHRIIDVSRPEKVTRHNVCPICGKPDWCFKTTSAYSFDTGPNEEFDFISCRRVQDTQVMGEDGNIYIYDKTSSDGVHIYEEVNQRAHRYERMGLDQNVRTPVGYQVKSAKKKKVLCENNLASIERRDEVYRAFFNLLYLEDYHRDHLYGDNWKDDMIDNSLFKSLPPSGYEISKLIKAKKAKKPLTGYEEMMLELKNKSRKKICQELYRKFGDLEGIPGFYLKYSKFDNSYSWDIAGKTGIIMPMFDVNGRIFGLRTRADYSDNGKYKWISSYFEKEVSRTDEEVIYDNPMKKGSRTPLRVSYLFPDYQTPFLFVTEGEKKQRVVVEKKGIACANIPGVSSFSNILNDLTELKAKGIKFIIIGYDADKLQNVHVLRAELSLIKALYEEGFQIFIAEWPEALGKGVDDVLLGGSDITYESLENYLDKLID